MLGIGVPLKLLHEAEGHVCSIELKTGEIYRGKLVEAEDNMNSQMTEITFTGRDGRVQQLETVYIRGSKIRCGWIALLVLCRLQYHRANATRLIHAAVTMSSYLIVTCSRGSGCVMCVYVCVCVGVWAWVCESVTIDYVVLGACWSCDAALVTLRLCDACYMCTTCAVYAVRCGAFLCMLPMCMCARVRVCKHICACLRACM